MTGFHDVQLPVSLALGAIGGPERPTEIVSLSSGKEVRSAKWSQSRRRWDIGSAISDLASLHDLVAFFEARQGPLFGFRFRDPFDWTSAASGNQPGHDDQFIGAGNGSKTSFQLIKSYAGKIRTITKPILGTVVIGVAGIHKRSGWELDETTGIVSFDSPPANGSLVTAGFEFDCEVRFETEQHNGIIEAFGVGRVASVTLKELI